MLVKFVWRFCSIEILFLMHMQLYKEHIQTNKNHNRINLNQNLNKIAKNTNNFHAINKDIARLV